MKTKLHHYKKAVFSMITGTYLLLDPMASAHQAFTRPPLIRQIHENEEHASPLPSNPTIIRIEENDLLSGAGMIFESQSEVSKRRMARVARNHFRESLSSSNAHPSAPTANI